MDVGRLKDSVNGIGAWADLPFFDNGQFCRVRRRLLAETRPVLPAAEDVFKAFALVEPCDVRVVILGQDPYPQPDRATGLAFAVPVGSMPERGSLANIFDKLQEDPSLRRPTTCDLTNNCDLTGWAEQGVLLLNTVLTVPENKTDGHRGIGWRPLINQALQLLAPRDDIAWLLCGYRAKQRKPRNLPQEQVIATGHPSRKHLFDVCRPFSCINRFLWRRGRTGIDWRHASALPPE